MGQGWAWWGHSPEPLIPLSCHRQSSDMSSKASSKRPATVPSEPPNHAMVAEVPSERPGGRVSAQGCVTALSPAQTGNQGPPARALSISRSPQAPRSSRKGIAFGKRSNSMKRNPNAAVTKSGWLYKQVPTVCHPFPVPQSPRAALTAPLSQASSGVKQWNKRWFVLVDRCLFYYKGTAAPRARGHPTRSQALSALHPGVCSTEGLIPSSPRLPGSSRARHQ